LEGAVREAPDERRSVEVLHNGDAKFAHVIVCRRFLKRALCLWTCENGPRLEYNRCDFAARGRDLL
jgi:hypothetical protein